MSRPGADEAPARLRAAALVSFGHVLYVSARYKEALKTFELALEHDPEYLPARVAQANALAMLLRFREALRVCDDVITKYPGFAEGYTAKGNLLYKKGDALKAISLYRKGVALGPDDDAPHYDFACFWAREGNEAECRRFLDRALELRPKTRSLAAVDPAFERYRTRKWFQELVVLR